MSEEHTRFSDPTTVDARRASFGATATTYDALRPGWPEETVTWMLGRPSGPLSVLDLGAGTGLGTRTIAGLGHEVVAVDPSAEMLDALRVARDRLPAEQAARINLRVGTAETLPDGDASYDVVTSFQAWHWVDASRAEPECARVLRPGGWLSLAWHSWANDVPWLRELAEIVDTPDMIYNPDANGAATAEPIAEFVPPENEQFAASQQLTADDLARLASTWSPVAVRDDRDDVLAAVHELGRRVADDSGMVTFGYVSDCYRYRRHP